MGPALGAMLFAKIALLGPEGSPVLARVARNLANDDVTPGVAPSCTRGAVAEAAKALAAETVVCTDGDVVTVWRAAEDGLKLVDAVPVTVADDRALEVIAARVTSDARDGHAPAEEGATMTIVASPAPAAEPSHDMRPIPPPARVAPPLVLSAGPTLFASSDGSSLGFQVQGEIGLGRFVAVTPWVGVVPAPRHVTSPSVAVGTAEYRPTLFGCGVDFPLLGPGALLVPRLGAGYAMLWVRTWPDKVGAAGVANVSEDLFAPVTYGTASASLRLSSAIRMVLDGMLGVSTSELDIRLAGNTAARWGVPLASLGLRAEYVLR